MGLETTLNASETHDAFRDGLNPEPHQQQKNIPNPEHIKGQKLEDIDVRKLTQEDPNVITVDWGASEKGTENKFFQGETKKVSEPIGPNFGPTNTQPYDKEKFKVGVKIMVAVIDFAMSSLLNWFAKDNKVNSYTAETPAKRNLEDAIVEILDESKVRMPAWLVVLFAFLGAYGFQVLAAIEMRKKSEADRIRIANLEKANAELKKKHNQEVKPKENQQSNQQANTNQQTNQQKTQEPKKEMGVIVHVADEHGNVHIKETILPDGLILRDGIKYRRYKNGKEYVAKFDATGREIMRGAVPRHNGRK